MCGFLAEYSTNNTMLPKSEFVALLELSRERGPDKQGYFSIPNTLQFGFNRLSILELSEAGHQPMVSHDGRYVLVFNGEIYNHLELRKKINCNTFRGQSDTETIVACLVEWGLQKTVEKLNGMFAMVVYDQKKEEVSLVRDFAGIKPLFYGWDGHTLVCSSQYNQITNHRVYKNKPIDSSVLKLYLEQHFMPAPFGLFKNTFQVLPGEIITFNKTGKKKHTRYWELSKDLNYQISNTEEAIGLVDNALNNAVEKQLLSHVPLGAFLSGGVDSPLVCSYAKQYHPEIATFTIGSDSKKHDESDRAKQFAKAMEVTHNAWHLSAKETLDHWDEAMNCLHEPLADFSILPTFLVSKLAKQHVTVSLSGDGGDELFFGYERFWSIGKNIKFQHYPEVLRKALYGFDKVSTGNKRLNSVLLAKKQSSAHQGLHSRFHKDWLDATVPDLTRVSLPKGYSTYTYKNSQDTRQLLANMRYAEFYGMMQKTLRKVDLASMGNSLEVRVPFLDKNVIETILKIDPLLSYGKGNAKGVLKGLLNKRIPSVPKETVKKGFSIPLTAWLREDLMPHFKERLLDVDGSRFGIEKKTVEAMLNAHLKKESDLKWPLFTLYALKNFK